MSIHHRQVFPPEGPLSSLRLIVAGALISLCCAVSFALDATKPTIVYPTGAFPRDANNVQVAIDLGGTVLLKATNTSGKPTAFNFGTPDPAHPGSTCIAGVSVSIRTDVAIIGEQVGGFMATISGGCSPLQGLVPVRTKIEGIDFEAPVGSAIVLLASTGTEIVGNRINGVLGAEVEVASGFEFSDGDGIDLFGNDDPQHAITGHAVIANNVIENLGAEFANGIQLDEVAAAVDISGNTIRFQQSNGDVQTVGITAFRSHSRVSIVGNDISMGPGSLNAFPAPVLVGGDHDARYVVAFNNILTDHPNGDGIQVTGGDFSEPTQGAQVFGNHITIHSSSGGSSGPSLFGAAGVDVFGAVNDSLIATNVIEGTSAFALDVDEGFVSTSISDADQLLLNDISGHTSLITDVYFGTNTSNMSFAGHCLSDIDLGVDNKITCNSGARYSLSLEHNAASKLHANDSLRESVHQEIIDNLRGRSPK
jgi:hypothetical protein